MDKNAKFILTSDPTTVELLSKTGFKLINSADGKYIFLNEPNRMVFTDKNVIFTNKLCF